MMHFNKHHVNDLTFDLFKHFNIKKSGHVKKIEIGLAIKREENRLNIEKAAAHEIFNCLFNHVLNKSVDNIKHLSIDENMFSPEHTRKYKYCIISLDTYRKYFNDIKTGYHDGYIGKHYNLHIYVNFNSNRNIFFENIDIICEHEIVKSVNYLEFNYGMLRRCMVNAEFGVETKCTEFEVI